MASETVKRSIVYRATPAYTVMQKSTMVSYWIKYGTFGGQVFKFWTVKNEVDLVSFNIASKSCPVKVPNDVRVAGLWK